MPNSRQAASPAAAQSLCTVTVNGLAVQTAAPTLEALLAAQGFTESKVATAVNGAFVPARARAHHSLAEGDHIEVVSARQGG
jgi:sulfur carrier protein